MVKTPLTSMSIKSMKTVKSPTGSFSIKSPLANLFSPSTMHFANKRDEAELMGNKDFRNNVLEPNGIVIADNHMHEEDWAQIAFSLGIPVKQAAKPTVESSRLVSRMRKRKYISDAQTVEAVSALLQTFTTPLSLSQEEASEFYMDAVPCREELKNSVKRVPKPCPSISIGYNSKSFAHIDDELQKGIIANEHGYPVDLGRISQPVMGHYWPFLIVEVSDHSMIAAKHACAVSASSCSNAVRLLTHAAKPDNFTHGKSLFNHTGGTKHCFSLSIHGKIASLNVHESDESDKHILRTITAYSLDDEDQIALMAERINSIMVWGRYTRLPEIGDQLEALDRKVNGGLPPCYLAYQIDDFDPALLKQKDVRRSKNKKKIAVLHAGIPAWVRDGGIMTA